MTCSYTECDKKVFAYGFCAGHNWQRKNYDELKPLRTRSKNDGKICCGPQCNKPSEKRGYCQTHYQQEFVYKIELKPIAKKIKCAAQWCARLCNESNGHGLCNKCKSRFDKYEINFDEFILISGKCDICGSSDRWAIDHDHKTGSVRGILCRSHNLGLGMIGDTIDDVKNLLKYLENHVTK